MQFPLVEIDQAKDKSAEHWFDHYSSHVQKVGTDNITLLNKDSPTKHELVRFRGMISNQLNNEYFTKSAQFREASHIAELPENTVASSPTSIKNEDIMQRVPMIVRSEPNQTEWNRRLVFNDTQPQVDAVLAKFYCHTKSLKICDCVEIFGIWLPQSSETDNQEAKSDNQENKKATDLCSAAPPAHACNNDKLPKIHVLYYRNMDWANPLVSRLLNSAHNDFDAAFQFYHENASSIRASLIQYIAVRYTANDYLMAEYILLNMVSQIVPNKAGLMLGYFPLNIRGQFDNYKLRELYQLLMPFVLNLNLNIDFLNAKRLVPVKNHQTDELEIGCLQFRPNTMVVVDATLLQEGELNQAGLQNVEALKELISGQKVLYDFQFHSIPFEVKSSVVVLSKSKPLPQFSTDCVLYAECDEVADNGDAHMHGDDDAGEEEEFTLDQFRTYLTVCSHRVQEFSLDGGDVCQQIQEDFVNLRKEDPNATEQDLHHRLLIMRLINSSFVGQTNDSDMINMFRYMQMLETKRRNRNKKYEPSTTSPATNGKNNATELNPISEE